MSSRIALICVTYNNYETLIPCLKSLYENTVTPYHLFLIDNNSSDGTRGLYGMSLKNTTIIKNNENKWWSGGINQGIALSHDFDYVAFLNDDIEVPYRWDINHIEVLSKHERAGAVGPLNSNTRDWQGYNNTRSHFKLDDLPSLEGIDPYSLKEINEKLSSVNLDAVSINGMLAFFCTVFRRKVIDEVGYLSEEFIMGGDDDDYARRLNAKGYDLWVLLNTYIIHHGGKSINKQHSEFSIKCKKWNISLLRKKYPQYYGQPTENDLKILDQKFF